MGCKRPAIIKQNTATGCAAALGAAIGAGFLPRRL